MNEPDARPGAAAPSPGAHLLAALDTVIERHPRSAALRFARARIFDGLGDAGHAEAGYREVIAVDRRHYRANNDLGLLLYRAGRHVDALYAFLAAVDADATQAGGHANLGALLLAGDDVDGARASFERALAIAPDQPTALQGLTLIAERLGTPPPAVPATIPRAVAPSPLVDANAAPDPLADYVFEILADAIVAGDDDAAHELLALLVDRVPTLAPLFRRAGAVAESVRRHALALALYDRALTDTPADRGLLIDRAVVLEEMGDHVAARAAWVSGALRGAVRRVPYTGAGEPVRLLTVASALHAIRYELFTDPRVIANTILYTQGYAADVVLPAHDVVLVAVADPDSDGDALTIAETLLTRTGAPVLNDPARVRATSRAEQARRLGTLANVVTPRVIGVARDAVRARGITAVAADHGFVAPYLVRSPGFHNGRFFELVRTADEAERLVAAMPGDELLLISYAETRAGDGLVRKYRVMTIGGRLYPVHLAISRHWKVHYISSSMANDAALRAEEARFLDDMPATLGAPAVAALRAIGATMELDYGGIDFGLTADGRVVVFEANGAMAIFLPDDDPRWDYRRAAMTRALRAATDLIVERGRAHRARTTATVG